MIKVKRDLALLNKQHLERLPLELSQLGIYLSRECIFGRDDHVVGDSKQSTELLE